MKPVHVPAQAFKAEIAAYRQKWLANNPNEEIPEIVRALLKRWESSPEADKIWATLQSKLPVRLVLTPEEFIYLVIVRRLLMEELKRVLRTEPGVISKADKRTKQLLEDGAYTQLIRENEARGEYQGLKDKLVSRNAKTAPRKRFAIEWSARFTEICGHPLDEVVAVLTEIAFGIEVTPDQVRGMRKPTTKHDRDIRRRPVSLKD